MHHMDLVASLFPQQAAEDLLETLAEVLGDQCIDNGVETGVGIGHAVGEETKGIGCLVEREVAIQVAENHHVIRQPAEAEEHCYNDNHLGHLALGFLRLGHVLQRVNCRPEELDGAGVGQADN